MSHATHDPETLSRLVDAWQRADEEYADRRDEAIAARKVRDQAKGAMEHYLLTGEPPLFAGLPAEDAGPTACAVPTAEQQAQLAAECPQYARAVPEEAAAESPPPPLTLPPGGICTLHPGRCTRRTPLAAILCGDLFPLAVALAAKDVTTAGELLDCIADPVRGRPQLVPFGSRLNFVVRKQAGFALRDQPDVLRRGIDALAGPLEKLLRSEQKKRQRAEAETPIPPAPPAPPAAPPSACTGCGLEAPLSVDAEGRCGYCQTKVRAIAEADARLKATSPPVICNCQPGGEAGCQRGEDCLCPCHPAKSADLSATVPVPDGAARVPADQLPERDIRDVDRRCLLAEFAGITNRMIRLLAERALRTVGDVLDRATVLGDPIPEMLQTMKFLTPKAREVITHACETAQGESPRGPDHQAGGQRCGREGDAPGKQGQPGKVRPAPEAAPDGPAQHDGGNGPAVDRPGAGAGSGGGVTPEPGVCAACGRPCLPSRQDQQGRCQTCAKADAPWPGRCRICGCTEQDCRGCIARTGTPCCWTDVTRTLCSACLPLRNAEIGQIPGLSAGVLKALERHQWQHVGQVLDGLTPEGGYVGVLATRHQKDHTLTVLRDWIADRLARTEAGEPLPVACSACQRPWPPDRITETGRCHECVMDAAEALAADPQNRVQPRARGRKARKVKVASE